MGAALKNRFDFRQARAPVRVVVFTGGPTLRRSIRHFVFRLEEHPEIELLGVYCQSQGTSLRAVMRDLWQRRRMLAVPLMLAQLAGAAGPYLLRPRAERALRRGMDRLSGRIHYVPDIHAPVVLKAVRRLAPELGLIYGSPILRPELFQIPVLGTLGIHHGKLPAYRGKKTTFWALFNGEPTAGVTIQKVNAGLDTGDVVEQGEVPARGRSLHAVWRDLEQLGYELYLRAILAVGEGSASLRPQSGMKGKLYRDPGPADILRFWSRRIAGRLARRRRAPQAQTTLL